MSIALIGGLDRLKRHYFCEAEKFGVDLEIICPTEKALQAKIEATDVIVIFTNKTSQEAKKTVMHTARLKEIPVYVHHSRGVRSLRDCLNCLMNNGCSRRFQ